MAARIGILYGSFRTRSNCEGIASWVATHLNALGGVQVLHLSPAHLPYLPLGPILHNVIPQAVKQPSDYPIASAQEWSKLISSLDGLIIVSPQYNLSFSGDLKNCLDHLYHEWKDLPVVIATYGGRGGGRAGIHLKEVLEHGLKANLISQGELEYTLPVDYIRGDERVNAGAAFLADYEQKTIEVLRKLLEAVQSKRDAK